MSTNFKGVYVCDVNDIINNKQFWGNSTFIYKEHVNYSGGTAFSWVGENGLLDNFYPRTCRGILCTIFYHPSVREKLYYGNPNYYQVQPEFKPDYSKLNLLVCIEDSRFQNLEQKIKNLNKINLFKLDELLSITLNQEITNIIKKDNLTPCWSAYTLTGPPAWISSAPIVSFLTGCIKYNGWPEINNWSAESFLEKYKNSSLYTNNPSLITEFWKFPIDKLRSQSSHDWGAASFYQNRENSESTPTLNEKVLEALTLIRKQYESD
jgi:hypothetical protein